MTKASLPVASLFEIPKRFHRSIQLERDFHDATALEHYVVTPSVAEAFDRIAHGVRSESGRRAWRITGDYGVGKSSFALVLAHLLNDRSPKALSKIADAIGWQRPRGVAELWPILLTGSRENIVPALARGIAASLSQRKPTRGRMPGRLSDLIKQARSTEARGDIAALELLLTATSDFAAQSNAGILLIIDELGKFLEFAAQEPEREDVFVLQRLAELASRTSGKPFVLVGLLHQGFQAYAERLPTTARHEWEKVAGRFDEIVFDQPLVHTAALVSGALNIDPRKLAVPIRDAAREAGRATSAVGWLGGGTSGAASLDIVRLYPLHPTLLPVLVRFFSRFGQNERSLFGFLLSTEPFGLQAFAAQSAGASVWYRVSDFYDYVRGVFGHRLTGASYRNHWLRIVETVNAAPQGDSLELAVLKAVAMLNLLDADDLLPTARALNAIFSPIPSKSVEAALGALAQKKVLFARGIAGGYRLWPSSSVDLDGAIQAAHRHVGQVDRVSDHIRTRVDVAPIVARRHYLERGTLRYFQVQYVPARGLANVDISSGDADGHVIVALVDDERDRAVAEQAAREAPISARADTLVAITKPLASVAPVVTDVLYWEHVAAHTPELSEDKFAAAEVARQLSEARRILSIRLGGLTGLRQSIANDVSWFRKGHKLGTEAKMRIPTLVSEICNEIYPLAPRIFNELLNRNALSSAAAAARMRLIEQMLVAGDQESMGLALDKAPPERAMYLSVLKKGNVHVADGETFTIAVPAKGRDPLNLRPALGYLMERVRSERGGRVPINSLFEGLRASPYGVRRGAAPLLLAIVLSAQSHELAIYENGTFLHRFGPSEFLRLTKAPAGFEVQHCQIEGVRAEVFHHLAAAFAKEAQTSNPDLLDVVKALCSFAAQLPEYTRRRGALSDPAIAVRDHLLAAREPVTLVFRDLPVACGVGAFEVDETIKRSNRERAKTFIPALQEAINELRNAYPELLRRIVGRVAEAMEERADNFSRADLSVRAARISLVAREPRLRAFALRLRDLNLSDEAWAEALASFVVSKPPARWLPGDEARFTEEISALFEIFHKTEAVGFQSNTEGASAHAVRLNLTRGDGHDVVRVVDNVVLDADLTRHLSRVEEALPDDRPSRLRLLTQLLWRDLAKEDADVEALPSNTAKMKL